MKRNEKPKKKRSFLPVLIAIAGGIAAGLLLRLLPENAGDFVTGTLLSPVSKAILGFLGTLSSFVIFFSILSGICAMQDTASLRSVGGRLLCRFLLYLLVGAVLCVPFLLLLFPPRTGGSAAFSFGTVWSMLLDIVPTDLLGTFSDGNSVGIIFLSVVTGVVLLSLSDRVRELIRLAEQVTLVLQTVLLYAVRLMPAVVFISLTTLFYAGEERTLLSVWRYPAAMLACCLIASAFSVVHAVVKTGVRPGKLLKKMLPAFLVGLTTSSSAASMPVSMETCEKELGIDKKLVDVGVPLGQTLFKPGLVYMFMSGCFCLAWLRGVSMGIAGVIFTAVSALVFSVAAPAVPGCSISCFTLLFAQIGIPADAISVIIALDPVNDRLSAAIKSVVTQAELICFADGTGELDKSVLNR